jgi:hypothetical protein
LRLLSFNDGKSLILIRKLFKKIMVLPIQWVSGFLGLSWILPETQFFFMDFSF